MREQFKLLLNKLFGITLFIIYVILFAFITLWNFIVPGKCEHCKKKWNVWRSTIIKNNDEHMVVCKECKKHEHFIVPESSSDV